MKKFTITIGTTFDKDGNVLNHKEAPKSAIQNALIFCADLGDGERAFDGWTIVETFGGWFNGSQWVTEKGLQIVIYSDFDARYFKHVAKYIGEQFNQDTAVLSVEDAPETHFVKC